MTRRSIRTLRLFHPGLRALLGILACTMVPAIARSQSASTVESSPTPSGLGETPPSLPPLPLQTDFGVRRDALGLRPLPFQLGPSDGPFLGPAMPAQGSETRPVTLVPSLAVQLLGTDNINQTSTGRRGEFATLITPGLFGQADTALLRGRLSYAPTIQFYAPDSRENRVDHRFYGQGVATLVPQTLFLDVRGRADSFAPSGGFAPDNRPVVSRGERVQSVSGQISPYLVHRFGGLAEVSLGYAFLFAKQSGGTTTSPGGSQPFFVPQEFTGNQGYAVIRTGEDFGRFGLEARASGTSYSGTGILDGAHQTIGTVEARYAILRGVVALAEVGYQDEEYATAPRFRYSGPVWSVGGRFTPTPDTLVVAKYGQRSGFDTGFLNAVVPIGGRTTLFADYTDRLSTSLLRAQELLASTTLDEFGNPVNQVTGAPVSYADSFLASQSGLFRFRRFSATISQAWPRDILSLGISYLEQIPVAPAPGTQIFGQRGIAGSIGWTRDVAARTQLSSYVSYGTTHSSSTGTTATIGSGDVVTAQVALRYYFTEKLLGTALYRFTRRGGFDPAGDSLQNLVLLGLQASL